MRRRSRPLVALVSAPGTLAGIDPLLRSAGVRLVRIASLRSRPVGAGRWVERLAGTPPPDTVIVTSRAAVTDGIEPWRRIRREAPATIEYWAAGPGTTKALRASGVRRVRQPRILGARGILRGLQGGSRRNIVYFRSEEAGPLLARQLREQGHRVVDVVVYRLLPARRLGERARRDLARADLVVVTSPSALSGVRRGLDRRSFLRLRHSARLIVLGERSRRAAQGHGFRQVSVAPSTNAQRFTRHLLRELRDAST